jgi:hypothetical protein
MNPIQKYHSRYLEIKKEKAITNDSTPIDCLLSNDVAGLNNYFMAGLGMGTLILRMGAVIQLCRKFESLDENGDALFMKQIIDNLRETLPSDTNWKNLWVISCDEQGSWKAPTIQPKGGQALLDRFVTFRNRFVHQQIRLIPEYVAELLKAIELLDEVAQLASLFEDGQLEIKEDKYHWTTTESSVSLYPYMQVGKDESSPYIFQGLHQNKTKAHLLNTTLGDETEQDANDHLEPNFEPIRDALRGGAGQVFDHSTRIAYYRECFVGRERERDQILEWAKVADAKNILTVKSPAGMGKGALVADVIHSLLEQKIQVLYHFCGSGIQNSLHATLYHLIIQGKRSQYWDSTDESIQRKLERLPSKYIDVIHLFHALLDEHLKVLKANTSGNLVIIIDGLDEAQVAYAQLKISDWFYTYNEKEEPEEDWRSALNIRWIFTYRCEEDGTESFFRFPTMTEQAEIKMLQPMNGLEAEAVEEAFKGFPVSKEFTEAVVEKATIQ